MFTSKNRIVDIKMACGHSEDASLSYRGTRQLASERRDMSMSVCGECRRQLEAWMTADFGKETFPMDLPPLSGASAAQIGFATKVRDKEFSKYGPLMLALSKMDTELAMQAWRSLYMRFMVTSSRYWLDGLPKDGRDQFTVWHWASEVRYLMKEPGFSEKPHMNSPYGWFVHVDRYAIAYIKAYDPTRDLKGTKLPILRYWTADTLKKREAVAEQVDEAVAASA